MTSKLIPINDYLPFTSYPSIYEELGASTIIQAVRDYRTATTKKVKREVRNWIKSNKGTFMMFIRVMGADIELIRVQIYKIMEEIDAK